MTFDIFEKHKQTKPRQNDPPQEPMPRIVLLVRLQVPLLSKLQAQPFPAPYLYSFLLLPPQLSLQHSPFRHSPFQAPTSIAPCC